jgi:hypothetical protein
MKLCRHSLFVKIVSFHVIGIDDIEMIKSMNSDSITPFIVPFQ